jgi:hypothetical protein
MEAYNIAAYFVREKTLDVVSVSSLPIYRL